MYDIYSHIVLSIRIMLYIYNSMTIWCHGGYMYMYIYRIVGHIYIYDIYLSSDIYI